MGIADFNPKPDLALRPCQVDHFGWTEKNWDEIEVAVNDCPTAFGKSLDIVGTCQWAHATQGHSCAIVVPQKMLQDQYQKDFPLIPLLKGMNNYPCDDMGPGCTCRDMYKTIGKFCNPGACHYLNAVKFAEAAPVSIYNLHSYHAHDVARPVLCVDEAHNSIGFLRDIYTLRVWRCEVLFDDDLDCKDPNAVAEVVSGAVAILASKITQMRIRGVSKKVIQAMEDEHDRLERMAKAVTAYFEDFIVRMGTYKYEGENKEFDGQQQRYCYIRPLRIRRLGADILWPAPVKKILLYSATISELDVRELGLLDRKVVYYHSDSPIPPENRKVVFWPQGSMAFKNRANTIPKIASAIKDLADKTHPGERGIVHAIYDVAYKLRQHLGNDPRFIFHSKADKKEQFDRFLRARGAAIFVCSGMEEGIDLPYDLARWQAITQFRWPFLGDPVNEWMKDNDPDLYYNDGIRKLIQSIGRVCRTPTDTGFSYVLDSEAYRVYKQTTSNARQRDKFWPRWVLPAVVEWV